MQRKNSKIKNYNISREIFKFPYNANSHIMEILKLLIMKCSQKNFAAVQ